MHGMNEHAFIKASRSRLILAIYLDLLIFSVPWTFLHLWLFRSSPDLERLSTPAKFVLFTLLEIVLHRLIRWSPGTWLLAVRSADGEPGSEATVSPSRRARVVEHEVWSREHWVTMLAAVLLLLEGTKGLVRWAMWTPPMPLVGATVPDEWWPAFAILSGAIECYVAYLLFRTRGFAALGVGVPYFVAVSGSILASWDLWDGWMAESITRRRAFQGLPLRAGEIDQMQSLSPGVVLLGPAFYLLLLVIAASVLVHRRRSVSMTPVG